MTTDPKKVLKRAARAYSRLSREYEGAHGEIFNPVEQEQLGKRLERGVALITSVRDDDGPLNALDFGCGSGNLTAHLLDLGLNVVAADVSPDLLEILSEKFEGSSRVKPLLLGELGAAALPSASFDLIGAYSVLHHLPDYLAVIEELVRLLRPGGILYLDHEANNEYWNPSAELTDFREAAERAIPAKESSGRWDPDTKRWQRFLMPSMYLLEFRLRRNPRYQPEGDIHVWPDDHIEWNEVELSLREKQCEICVQEDYLLFRRGYPPDLYERYRSVCSDTRLMIARKRSE